MIRPRIHTCDSCDVTGPGVMAITLTVHKRTRDTEKVNGAGALRLCPDCWARFGVRCDLCSVSARRVRIRRMNMVRRVPGTRTSKGMGSAYLCERCWKLTAAPRRITARRPVAAAVAA